MELTVHGFLFMDYKYSVRRGYVGLALVRNGVAISTVVCHGQIMDGDNIERVYTFDERIQFKWHLRDDSAVRFEGSKPLLYKDFAAICRREKLTCKRQAF